MPEHVPSHLAKSCPLHCREKRSLHVLEFVAGHRVIKNVRAMFAPFTRYDDLERRIVQRKAQRLVTFLHDLFQTLLLDVHLPPLQVKNIARSQAGVDRKQDQVAEVRGCGAEEPLLLVLTEN